MPVSQTPKSTRSSTQPNIRSVFRASEIHLLRQPILLLHLGLFAPPDSNLPLARRKELASAARGRLMKEQPVNLEKFRPESCEKTHHAHRSKLPYIVKRRAGSERNPHRSFSSCRKELVSCEQTVYCLHVRAMKCKPTTKYVSTSDNQREGQIQDEAPVWYVPS